MASATETNGSWMVEFSSILVCVIKEHAVAK